MDNQEPLPYLVEPVENVTEGQTSDIPPESDHGSSINPSLVLQCGDDYCGSDSGSQYPLTECSQSLVGVVQLLLTLHWILKAQEKRVFLQVPESFVFFGHLGLVFIWSCFVFCLLLLLYYVICAPVLTERTRKTSSDSCSSDDRGESPS